MTDKKRVDSMQEERPKLSNFEMALAEMIMKARMTIEEPWVVAAQWKDELVRLARSEEPVDYNNLNTMLDDVLAKETKESWNKRLDKDKFIKEELGHIKGYREKAIKELERLEKEYVSEDLDKAAEEYAYKLTPSIGATNTEIELAFKAGANWQKQKDNQSASKNREEV